MAQLVLNWLNEEVKLSRHVFSLEDDFKDGYLLGELLHKYNQQSNFAKFSETGTPDAKITNFCLLEPAMRQIGINFNAKIAFDLMHGVKGTAKNLIYETRATLEGIRKRNSRDAQINAENDNTNTMSKTGNKLNGRILTVLRHDTRQFDKTMTITFENAVRAMMENPNDVLMEKITRKFDQKKMDFRQTVNASHQQGMDTMQLELTRRIDLLKHTKVHNKSFSDAYELIHENQWKQNQKVAHERRSREDRFDATAVQRKEFIKHTGTTTIRDNLLISIDDFERRLENDLYRDDSSMKKSLGKALRKMTIEVFVYNVIDA
jgi:hypothetical protein